MGPGGDVCVPGEAAGAKARSAARAGSARGRHTWREGIMQRGIAENAYLSKWAGGLGGSWTAVRGTGSHISGTNGESQGIVPFLKLHNDLLIAVNQGGKRPGAGCAYLEPWHLDFEDFLNLSNFSGKLTKKKIPSSRHGLVFFFS